MKMTESSLNPLGNEKILHVTKLKVFADQKLNIVIMISLNNKVESTVGRKENDVYQHYLFFPQCFPKPSLGSSKVGIVR